MKKILVVLFGAAVAISLLTSFVGDESNISTEDTKEVEQQSVNLTLPDNGYVNIPDATDEY